MLKITDKTADEENLNAISAKEDATPEQVNDALGLRNCDRRRCKGSQVRAEYEELKNVY